MSLYILAWTPATAAAQGQDSDEVLYIGRLDINTAPVHGPQPTSSSHPTVNDPNEGSKKTSSISGKANEQKESSEKISSPDLAYPSEGRYEKATTMEEDHGVTISSPNWATSSEEEDDKSDV
ncbi:hypothetical protein LTR37_012337 [Vermiconidia calcicola]|uniref:Uncharacterized protein n=1 Tax=Vermiconidia calcicola TaxID=1690605 RepID=A0ACC3MZQ1_9PEZI|nr:hypothetical protein LTR37_012337 [Vermiconidia calcicola]